jgi:hypothetical protein
MKLIQDIITVVLWVVGAIALVFLGWMLKAYQVRRSAK